MKEAIQLLAPEIIVSIGRYSEDRIKDLQKQGVIDSKVKSLYITHPSPRSLNNTNWVEKAEIWFKENDILQYLQQA